MHFILGLIIRCPQAPTKQTEETLAEQIPALLLDRSNKPGTKTAAAHARRAPAEACTDPGARTLEEMALAHLGGNLAHQLPSFPTAFTTGAKYGAVAVAGDATSMAVSFKHGMLKGQPRETSPLKDSWGCKAEGKTKAHPFAYHGEERTTATGSWKRGAAASECHNLSEAGGIPIVPRSLCGRSSDQHLMPGKLLIHLGQALNPRKKGLS